MLKLDKVCAGYGDLRVLFDVDLEVNEGEVVALVGSNGAGKTSVYVQYLAKLSQIQDVLPG